MPPPCGPWDSLSTLRLCRSVVYSFPSQPQDSVRIEWLTLALLGSRPPATFGVDFHHARDAKLCLAHSNGMCSQSHGRVPGLMISDATDWSPLCCVDFPVWVVWAVQEPETSRNPDPGRRGRRLGRVQDARRAPGGCGRSGLAGRRSSVVRWITGQRLRGERNVSSDSVCVGCQSEQRSTANGQTAQCVAPPEM